MAYGQTNEIVAEREARIEAIKLLVAVATGEKTVLDVRAWLEENYPRLCVDEITKKKW